MSSRSRLILATISLCAALAADTRTVSADPGNLVEAAVAAGSFRTLVSAVATTDFIDAFKTKGPFTVFAPTDEAFAKLPAGTLETLLRPENKAKLAAILSYHVVEGHVPAKKVARLKFATTLHGQRVDISVDHGKVRVDGATVVQADVPASNGIIHAIDEVLLPNSKDVVDTAVAAGSFQTLAAALGAADLVGALKGKGPFTVFAPTDEAFAKLPKGTVEHLLRPENKSLLASILSYHVVAGAVTSESVVKLSSATTLQGQRVDVEVKGGEVFVDGARVVRTDIEATNGVIHVIDRVILPNTDNIVATAVKAGSFKTLAAALGAASMVEGLRSQGPLTVFAPSDEAFAKLPQGTVDLLLKPENVEKLQAILLYHVVRGKVLSTDLQDGSSVKTTHGDSLKIRVGKSGVQINDARVVRADVEATNGVIHVIDSVLLPLAASATDVEREPSTTPTSVQPESTEDDRAASVDGAQSLIKLAIDRGVTAFNSGDHTECSAIYEVTAAALLQMPPRTLSASARDDLEKRVTDAKDEHDMRSRAWALRRALDLTFVDLAKTKARARAAQAASRQASHRDTKELSGSENMITLYDFSSASRRGSWRSVNDNVMGGVSRGGFRHLEEDRSLLFSGELSLENRGGFASIRTEGETRDLSGFDGLVLRVRGDGRTYKMNVYTSQSRWGGSYRVEFPTKKDTWTTVRLAFDDFRAQFHGRLLPNAPELNRSNVRSVGITLADKIAGPFRLEIDSIKAFSTKSEEGRETVRAVSSDLPLASR